MQESRVFGGGGHQRGVDVERGEGFEARVLIRIAPQKNPHPLSPSRLKIIIDDQHEFIGLRHILWGRVFYGGGVP